MAYTIKNEEQIEELRAFLKDANAVCADKETQDFFNDVDTYIETAKTELANTDKDGEEKEAYLIDALTRWSNQLVFRLFRDNDLNEELEKRFRSLETVTSTTEKAKVFADARQAKIDEINEQHSTVMAEQREFDTFRAIVGGVSPEEARAKQDEFEQSHQ